MAPKLRPGGIPVNQHKQVYPSPSRLCRCQDCLTQTAVDPVTKAMYRGSYVSATQWKDHQNQELARGVASTLLTPAEEELPRQNVRDQPPPSHTVPLNNCPSPASSHASSPPPSPSLPILGQMNRQQTNDLLMHALQGIQKTLARSRAVDIVADKPLVFRNPPFRHSPLKPDSLFLQENVPANSSVTGHESWLNLAVDMAHNQGLTSGDVHTRLLSQVLIADLEGEMENVQDFKAQEWERQCLAARALPQGGAGSQDKAHAAQRRPASANRHSARNSDRADGAAAGP